MKIILVFACLLPAAAARAHPWKAGDSILDKEALRAHVLEEWMEEHPVANQSGELRPLRIAARGGAGMMLQFASEALAASEAAPPQSMPFQAFAPRVGLRWDQDYLYVESDGLPDHNMMVGISNWQQQVPLPQNYTGDNAWRVPLHPVPSKTPVSIKGRFLRGAIALAANGIPIFNPQNNRGEISQEIGELDQWGGHCGRADDYHYHAAPLHLQTAVGKDQPIAYALDGYPIFGLTEPDGSAPGRLDEFNGHETAKAGYHYHASTKYPYVNGGFHGEVVEREGQVDPQPRANPVRQDLPPLRGARITDFRTTGDGKARTLTYTVGGRQGAVNYTDMGNGGWKFQFVSADGSKQEETYQSRSGRGGPPPRDERGPPRGEGGRRRPGGPDGPPNGGREPEVASKFGPDAMKKPNASFVLTSPEVTNGGTLPAEFTGDGSGATLPLSWRGAPEGTRGYALIMDHLAPGDVMKHYWIMWDIPANTTSLPKNVNGIGKVGTSFKGRPGYEPPHSQGPGAKTYVLTVYALSEPLQVAQPPGGVNRDVLLAAMKDKVLASASLNVVYTRSAAAADGSQTPPPPAQKEKPDGRPPQSPEAGSAGGRRDGKDRPS